ncbi:Imm1 family immunity protein [Micromonospora sp. ATCC 39149]|uniref:Imm1 family immunity protein n=1 Tax=Micromonospora sp. (strain ATCC 39149 / NRRL 15099 / SCC 1413) TaxID=219305 RepID=UPI0003188226|nr:Imm1 family immunity protein [Micromonospora sp. ATCC 39149]
MTFLLRDYHGHTYELTNPQEAGRRFDEQIEAIMPHGGCGQTLTIGTADQPALRIDIDIDIDRAALRWLPDGTYPSTSPPTLPSPSTSHPIPAWVEIPADLARVTAATARAAVIEYATTGQRPTNLDWRHEQHSSS